ncbi:nicotinate phosphoribosyltransferase [Candidatus Woesearchaeota archaeon]|nr:nicotinate phosphoribosyltransferase [Candidatus Woesearchaeota archaeon]
MSNKAMLTDLYQLTMGAVYHEQGKDDTATFDLFIRKLPKDWGYFIANGIEDAIDYLTTLKFEEDDIEYLRGQGFKESYLESLRSFRFEGEAYAVKEGTPIFANEPIMRITAKRTQAQLVETALLNMINYQTMIASKASRVVEAARGAKIADFGLRRAQEEDAAMKGSRACYLAGVGATSNVKAGKEYGIPITGTQAHSLVMSFPTELEAFRAYADTFPQGGVLLIDTYDTVKGARNAAKVGKELEAKGGKLGGVRLDSGELLSLSKKVRQVLDEQGLDYVKILASNDLNEYSIEELLDRGAPIDGFGVGTEMITAKPVAAIPGVYKLVEDEAGPKIKLSPGKRSLPGKKQVFRQADDQGVYTHDIIATEGEEVEGTPLLELAVKDGERARQKPTLQETRRYCLEEVAKIPKRFRQVKAPNGYKVELTEKLEEKIKELTRAYRDE